MPCPCPDSLMASTFDNNRQMIYVTLLICALIGLDECSQMTRYAGRANDKTDRKKWRQIQIHIQIESKSESESECKTRADNMEIDFYCHFYCPC